MYEEFVLKSYNPILTIINKHGIDTIILRTYANIRMLIPCILNHGFNCLWACETNSIAMDYRVLRKEFGRDLRLIGGLDLDALRYDKTTIRKEIEEKVPPLIASGGFIPIAFGIFFLVGAFKDWNWMIKNTWPLIKIIGRDEVRGYLALVGLFFIGAGIFLLIV